MDVKRWVGEAFPALGADAEAVHGAFHEVLIGREHVARVMLGRDQASRAAQEAAIHRVLPPAVGDIALPQLAHSPISSGTRTGYLVSRVPGIAHDCTWEQARDPFAHVLDALRSAEAPSALPAVRAWCGGSDLPAIVETRFSSQLGAAHSEAVRLAAFLPMVETAPPVFVHGDLGPHNVLWRDGQICGLVDLDHTAVGDPAVDVAPLIGFYGATAVSEIVDDDTLQRALWHRATLSLQVAAAADLCGLTSLRDHALRNFVLRRRDGVLFDPGGTRPD